MHSISKHNGKHASIRFLKSVWPCSFYRCGLDPCRFVYSSADFSDVSHFCYLLDGIMIAMFHLEHNFSVSLEQQRQGFLQNDGTALTFCSASLLVNRTENAAENTQNCIWTRLLSKLTLPTHKSHANNLVIAKLELSALN